MTVNGTSRESLPQWQEVQVPRAVHGSLFQLMPCFLWRVALRSWNDNACGRAFPFVCKIPSLALD